MATQKMLSLLLKEDGSNLHNIDLEFAGWRGELEAMIDERRLWPIRGMMIILSPNPVVLPEHSHPQGGDKVVKSFRFWKEFPPEVKNKIFDFACLEPRVVELSCDDNFVSSPTPAPAILHVCAASRERGMKEYKRLEGAGVTSHIYINWAIDTVYVKSLAYEAAWGNQQWPHALDEALSKNCKNLAVDFGIYPIIYPPPYFKVSPVIPSLRTLVMVSPFDVETIKKLFEEDRETALREGRAPTYWSVMEVLGHIVPSKDLDATVEQLRQVILSEAAEQGDGAVGGRSAGNITFVPSEADHDLAMKVLGDNSMHLVWERAEEIKCDIVFQDISRNSVHSADEKQKRRQREKREADIPLRSVIEDMEFAAR